MNSLRSDSIIFRGHILFPSLSTSTNFLRRLYARIHSRSFILQHCNFFSASGTEEPEPEAGDYSSE